MLSAKRRKMCLLQLLTVQYLLVDMVLKEDQMSESARVEE